ncbi:MAG: hypothetical protein K2P81_16865 [Bacteriovoracaceae bacterium]|nr:hypothetical protein [Bacteriovoracaceae bacterium]
MRDPNNESWRKKAIGVLQACEHELRRTTAIGMKMIHASKASTDLHSTYEELGRLVAKAMKEGDLDWNSQRARVLIQNADELEVLLQEMEGQVQDLKRPNDN